MINLNKFESRIEDINKRLTNPQWSSTELALMQDKDMKANERDEYINAIEDYLLYDICKMIEEGEYIANKDGLTFSFLGLSHNKYYLYNKISQRLESSSQIGYGISSICVTAGGRESYYGNTMDICFKNLSGILQFYRTENKLKFSKQIKFFLRNFILEYNNN